MIEQMNVLRASIGKYLFVVGYFVSEKKHQKGYWQTTKYGSETEVRELLKSSGVPDAQIDQLFQERLRIGHAALVIGVRRPHCAQLGDEIIKDRQM